MYGRTPTTPGPGSAPSFKPTTDELSIPAAHFAILPFTSGSMDTLYGVFHVPSMTLITPGTDDPEARALREHLDTAILTAAVCRKEMKR